MSTEPKPEIVPTWAGTAGNANIHRPTNTEISSGWPAPIDNVGTKPQRQRDNWFKSIASGWINYFLSRGAFLDYDATVTYAKDARIIGSDGKTYKALQETINHDPVTDNGTYWKRWGYNDDDYATTTTSGLVKVDGTSITIASGIISSGGTGSGVPTGAIMQFLTVNVPDGFLELSGQEISRTTYANLFNFASASGLFIPKATWEDPGGMNKGNYHEGDGSTTFGLPDLTSNSRYLRTAGTSRATSDQYPPGTLINFSTEPFSVLNNATDMSPWANWYPTDHGKGLKPDSLTQTDGIRLINPDGNNWDVTQYCTEIGGQGAILYSYPMASYDFSHPTAYKPETMPDSVVVMTCIKT